MTEEKTLNTGSLQEWARKPSNAGPCRGKAAGGEGPQGGHLRKRSIAWSVSVCLLLHRVRSYTPISQGWSQSKYQKMALLDVQPHCRCTGMTCSRLVTLGMCTMNPIETATKCKSCPVPGE